MGVVNILVVQKEIAAVLEAGPDDDTYDVASTDQGAYTPLEIIDRILEADVDVRGWIADSLKNGHRNAMLTNSTDIANGGPVPEHSGKLGTIYIKFADGSYHIGEEAPSLSALHQWQNDTTIFPVADIEGRYVIDQEEVIEFAGSAARVRYIPPLTIDRATPACQAPEDYTGAVTRRTLANLPRTFNASLIQEARVASQNDEMMIRNGEMAVQPFRRTDG